MDWRPGWAITTRPIHGPTTHITVGLRSGAQPARHHQSADDNSGICDGRTGRIAMDTAEC